MDDSVNTVFAHNGLNQVLVTCIADHQGRRFGDSPLETRRKVVDDNNALARVQQFQDHMAADVSRAARDQYAHRLFLTAPFICH